MRRLAGGPWARWLGKRWPTAVATSILVALFVAPDLVLLAPDYREGEFTQRAIKSRRTVTVEDVESTRARREQAALESPPVYDFRSELAPSQVRRIDDAFDRIRLVMGLDFADAEAEGGQISLVSKEELQDAQERFAETLGVDALSAADFQALTKARYSSELRALLRRVVEAAGERFIVNDWAAFNENLDAMSKSRRAVLVRDPAQDEESLEIKLDQFADLTVALREAEAAVKADAAAQPARSAALKIAAALVSPNTFYNPTVTEERRLAARNAVLPSMVKYAKNQVIVGEGEKVTAEKLAILEQVHRGASGTHQWLSFLSTTLLVLLLQWVVMTFAERNVSKFRVKPRDLLMLALVVTGSAFLSRLGKFIGLTVGEAVEFIPDSAIYFVLPIASAAMIVRIVMNSEVAFFLAVVVSAISGLLLGGDHAFATFVLLGSIGGAHFVRHASRRAQILKAGVWVGLINAATVLALQGFGGVLDDLLRWHTLIEVAGGFVGGLLAGMMVLAILPFIESLFGYTSNISLLELASLNHPLLKDMVLRAPGTYNHSTIVGSLAEAGAEGIAANPLMAKVASIYHDIGKLNKPQYFSENYTPDDNPHEKLYPSMSVLILTSHVREGVEMARRYGLGDQITDVIRQHHGTFLIKKHYDRALAAAQAKGATIREDDFRYPGPKPQTREAALVMLANAVEVRARTLPNPTPARLEQTVEDTINAIFLDNQLSECDLTLKDLGRVSRAFLKVMAGFYHSRIEYPEDPAAKRERKFQVVEDFSRSNS